MFRPTLALFSFFLLLTCAIAYWDHIRLRKTDPETYRQFVIDGSGQKARHALECHPATQKREQVQKDFWIPQNRERLHFRLKSKHSELILQQRKGKIEAVEKLRDLECWLQEQILADDSMQQVRHLTAEEGVYFYPSHHFAAERLHIQFFRLPGHELPEFIDPSLAFLSGTAREGQFSACGKMPIFKATHLQASFDLVRGAP